MEELAPRTIYMTVNLISKRVKDLFRGAKPLVEKLAEDESMESIAAREFDEGYLTVKEKKPPEKLVDIAQRG